MRLILLSFSLVMMIAEAGAEVLEVQPGQMLPVSVSRTGLSRIAFSQGNRIANVWGRSAMVEVETDSEGGQVFIKPRPGATSFALYLRDEHGVTYSLLVSLVDALPDSLLLKPLPADRPNNEAAGSSHVGGILRRMRMLLQDDNHSVDGGHLQRLPWWEDTTLYLVRSIDQDGILAEHYQLYNHGSIPLRLYEAEFGRLGGVLAVSLDLPQVEPGGIVDIYLLRRQQ